MTMMTATPIYSKTLKNSSPKSVARTDFYNFVLYVASGTLFDQFSSAEPKADWQLIGWYLSRACVCPSVRSHF